MSCQYLKPSLTLSHMHMPCMKTVIAKQKIFVYNSTHWITFDKLHYSKAMCLLWITNFPGSHRRCLRLSTLSRAFTTRYICLTKDAGLPPEGVSIPSCYYPTHIKPCDSRSLSLRQSPPLNTKHSVNSCHARTPVLCNIPVHM